MIINKSKSNFQSTYGGLKEIKHRIIFVISSLIIFRIGSFIPIPGINIDILTKLFEQQKGTIIEMMNMFSGGALSRASIFTLGIMPYISSSIIVQLLTAIHPTLSDLKKDGENGRRKLNKFTRYGALLLGLFQSLGIAFGLPNMPSMQGLVICPGPFFYLTTIISLTSGTIFLMWLGEQITIRGIGNGISIIIFTGIVAGLPSAIGNTIEELRQGELSYILLFFIIILIFLVIFFVVFMERGQRHIAVSYANRQRRYRVHSIQQSVTHLPLKINMSGVIPAIFASSIVLFPATLSSWFGKSVSSSYLGKISLWLQPGQPLYLLFYSVAVIFFCFFYTSLVFNSRETSDNLKKSGAFIAGIRPGEQTARYIDRIMIRLTSIGALYITFICLMPDLIRFFVKIPFYFGGTSLLIVVVVIMDFINQVQTFMISSQYESVLKKANLK